MIYQFIICFGVFDTFRFNLRTSLVSGLPPTLSAQCSCTIKGWQSFDLCALNTKSTAPVHPLCHLQSSVITGSRMMVTSKKKISILGWTVYGFCYQERRRPRLVLFVIAFIVVASVCLIKIGHIIQFLVLGIIQIGRRHLKHKLNF